MTESVITLPILATGTPSSPVAGLRTAAHGFVAGPENRLLAAVLIELVGRGERLALPSPLLFLGPAGSGKSLLAQGLAQQLPQTLGADRVALLTASDFRRQYADAIETDQLAAWRQRIRSLRMLILDDVDHLTSRTAVQQELLVTLDALADNGASVIATSQQPLTHLTGWEAGLASRLHAGLVIEIDPPSAATRAVLVQQMLERWGWVVTENLAQAITTHLSSELPLIARRVAELQQQFPAGQGASVTSVTQFLTQQLAASAPSLSHILQVVSRYYSVPRKQITSGSRHHEVVQARAMVITLARQLTPLSYEQIGTQLGGRDHTTMLHHHRKIQRLLATQVALRSAYNDLLRLVQVP